MRLVCPNCGAQYDVPLEVIPEAGRDVQCSNCGHTWFQRRVTQGTAARPLRPAPTPAAEPEAPKPEEPAQTAAPEQEPDTPADPDPEKPASRIDPEMAELFREEREFTAKQRAAESLETQPDLGLAEPDEDEQARRARESRERMARIKGEDLSEAPDQHEPEADEPEPALHAAAAAAAAASRKDLLPDVEEINQTLRSSSEPRVIDRDSSEPPAEKKSSFARGFLLMVVLAAIALAVYLNVPKLSQQVPAAAPYLNAYAETVDKGRLWLDEKVKALLGQLDQMSSEADTPDPDPAPDPDPDPIEDN
ncbi:zinc-ribbon domain-containing protein [Antarctobacter jejuensis]|uniref:zinc-ribbon domain-containing protein n=1 Tax=Antarctobacter jejuensis TaxID=1439938 RepID=UPI003FD34F1D